MNAATRSIAAVTLLVGLSTAGAWKPSTHMYIAEEALRDALDDGQVNINILSNGQEQTPPVVRTYAVDPALLAAIRADPRQYRAGVVGPDAYPDIATGQSVIHPGPGTVKYGPPGGIDTNRWLQHLWNSSRTESGAVKAFTAGYLTHAAEDMFGHTLIDYYTEKKFDFGVPLNAAKHLVLEGYIGKRTPNILKYDRPASSTSIGDYVTSDDMSIDGVSDFIYRNMIDAKPGTVLNNTGLGGGLYNGGGGRFAIPLIFNQTREKLQNDIDAYYTHKNDLIQQIRDCRFLDPRCSRIRLSAQLFAYMAANSVQVAHKENWRRDIDDGLRAWPALSHELNKDLVFPSAGADLSYSAMNVTAAKAAAEDYVTRHLLSMMGAPNALGSGIILIDSVTNGIINALGIPELRRLKDALINQPIEKFVDDLVKDATGSSIQDWREYSTSPERYFNTVMSQAPGNTLTLQAVNSMLHINDNQAVPDNGYANRERRFDVQQFPAAYNSLTIAKMVLLGPGEFRRLMNDVGNVPANVTLQDNAALGYIDSLDGTNQWLTDQSPYQCGSTFLQLFKRQVGGDPVQVGVCPAVPPTTTSYTNVTARFTNVSGRVEINKIDPSSGVATRVGTLPGNGNFDLTPYLNVTGETSFGIVSVVSQSSGPFGRWHRNIDMDVLGNGAVIYNPPERGCWDCGSAQVYTFHVNKANGTIRW